jgi:hypothetical protein
VVSPPIQQGAIMSGIYCFSYIFLQTCRFAQTMVL